MLVDRCPMVFAALPLILLAVAPNSQQHALAFTPPPPPGRRLSSRSLSRTRVHASISTDQQQQDHIEHVGMIFSPDDQETLLATDTTSAAIATDTINVATRYISNHESPANDPIKIRRPTMNKSLAFLAGVCDVICYRRHGCYANMLTGNTIQAANALSTLRLADMGFFLSILGSYMIGFGAYRAVDRSVQEHNSNTPEGSGGSMRRKRLVTPAVLAPVIITLFALYDMLAVKSIAGRWAMPILVFGSAMINSAGLESTGAVCNMMTGNFGKTANYITDLTLHKFLGGPEPSPDLRKGALRSGKIIFSFFSGVALTGAVITGGDRLLTRLPFVGIDALTIARLPHFTILGAAYATLLLLYSRTVAGKAASANRPSISHLAQDVLSKLRLRRKLGRRNNADIIEETFIVDPCSLDAMEADCHSSCKLPV